MHIYYNSVPNCSRPKWLKIRVDSVSKVHFFQYQLLAAYYMYIHTKHITKWLDISCSCGLKVVLKNSLSSFRETQFLALSH